MSKGFETGKIYEVSQEWKEYFDGFGVTGYYYVQLEKQDLNGYDLVKCFVLNKHKDVHPNFVSSIPFKFSDVKVCSLSSKSKLKLFHIWLTDNHTPSGNSNNEYYENAVVVAENEEEAATIHPNGIDTLPNEYRYTWASDPTDVEVDYLGDYYGNEKAGTVICASLVT